MNREGIFDRWGNYFIVGLVGIMIGLTASNLTCEKERDALENRNSPAYTPIRNRQAVPKRQETPKTESKPVSYKTDDFQNDADEIILARMIFGEARGCSDLEKTAVAYTALNRAEDGKAWNGKTIKEAVLKKMQYSCFNSDDANLEKLKDPAKYDENSWQKCLEIAGKVKNKTLADPTNGATHYHTRAVHPSWADELSVKLNNSDFAHIFYREN